MTRLEVHKFGGTSVGDATRIAACAAILAEVATRARIVAVSSALGGVTDRLVAATVAAAHGQREAALTAVDRLGSLHEQVLQALAPSPDDNAAIRTYLAETIGHLAELLGAASLLREVSPRTRDQVLACGEKLSVRLLVAALRARGVAAEAVDADTFLDTDDQFGEASALGGVADRTIPAALLPRLDAGVLPVVTGFTGRAPDGATTTLGRGGSDLTATLLAAALHAHEVTIWTDVDGVYTADPRVVPEARTIRQLHFREAAEMSFYGAKVLHPRTMIPVAALGIPVRTRNAFAPGAPGTLVDGTFTPGSHPVKAVTAVRAQALVSIEGRGMAGVPGVAARVFGALSAHGISVTMISQSSSEASIGLAVPDADALAAETALKHALRAELSRGDVDEVVVRRDVALVGVVGLGMARTPGVSARVFGALGARRVNVLAIAQGASELNITLAVAGPETAEALRALHAEFGLARLDTGEDTTRRLDLMLYGCGQIGRALARLVTGRRAHVLERFHLEPRIVAIADRSGWVLRPNGFGASELEAVLEAKAAGRALASFEGAGADPRAMVREALRYRLARPVLVDVSDDDDTAPLFAEAFALGADVVTANKKPLAGPPASFRAVRAAAAEHRRLLRAEATVGAGLPVIDTLEMLLSTGDRIVRAEGCLSGTLGFVMGQLEEGTPFSAAVAEAARRGYTEPDPVADLCGADVARKATILARLAGLPSGDAPVVPRGLVDASLAGRGLGELLQALSPLDAAWAEAAAAARRDGTVLRYVARVDAERIEVGPVAVPLDSPAGRLRATDNLVVFTTERYASRPLVVMGPGAGIDVTAMAVLVDVLRIAAERR